MAAAAKSNILIVDDLPEKVLVLESVLEELDQNVVVAYSGEDALRRVLEYDFAVILLDVLMPGMDGLETAAMIRRRKKSAHTPIIFITAYADEMQTIQGYSLGAVDYIPSPVIPAILRTKVKVFVDLYLMTQQVQRQADERIALAHEQMARAAAEEANRRSMFLAEASKVLANSLDYEATLGGLLRLTVPYLADLSAITLTDADGSLGSTHLAYLNAAGTTVNATARADILEPNVIRAVKQVVASGTSMQLAATDLGPDQRLVGAGVGNDADPALPIDLALQSVVLTPLLAREHLVGVLCLASRQSVGRYGPADVLLAEDLAGRAAIAIDNARLYRDIQRADLQKNEFLSMLAHELRNPLAPIRNGIHILRFRGSGDPELREVQDMIDRQVQHMVRLVDDLLDVSRITSGKIRLQKEPVDLAQVVARAVEISQPLLQVRGHEFSASVPEQPVYVMGDAVRLAQVLGNLLNNAAKYTQEKGRISINLQREGDEAIVRVRDNGVGIPPEMLGSIFHLFAQVERSLDRSHGGLGIGLTLVQRLVELHGGRVQAFSAGPNRGSDFVVHLPVFEESAPPAQHDAAVPPLAHVRRRVLLVDDNRDVAASLARLLRMDGHEVHVCHDGAAAVTAAAGFHPDVVLLDIGLPGMNGFEVARRLRAQPALSHTLLIAITGYGQEQHPQSTLEAGFNHYLVKPVDPVVLATLLAAEPPSRLQFSKC
jgi:signal transduction histidine kinase/DNA-binding response OmpR family regulator